MKWIFTLGIFLWATASSAQDYPSRDIRSVCNFSAGSGADIVVRWYSDRLSRLAGKPVVVENVVGAQGGLASAQVARAKPDGYTIMITPASSTIAAARHIFKQLPFDPDKDFAPVATLATLGFVIAVDAARPIHSVAELIADLKKKPNDGFYGTGTNTGIIAAELLKERSGLKTVHVPYKVTTSALTDLLLGQTDFIVYDASWATTQQQRLRILAITSARRSGTLPAVPTLQESGMGEFDITPWWGVVVPAGTPKPIVDRLAGWFNEITGSAEARQFLERYALDPMPGTPESMAALLKAEIVNWGRWAKLARIEPQ